MIGLKLTERVLPLLAALLMAGCAAVNTRFEPGVSYDPRCQNIINHYQIRFNGFTDVEIKAIMARISNQLGSAGINDAAFPCYVNHQQTRDGASQIYDYDSAAIRAKLYQWMGQVMQEKGFILHRDVVVMAAENGLIIDKINPAFNPSQPDQGQLKYR